MPRIDYEKEIANLEILKERTVHDRIRLLRYKKEETQAVFAENVGITLESLKRYETDQMPTVANLQKIAKYCDVTVSYILDEDIPANFSAIIFQRVTGLNIESLFVLDKIKRNPLSEIVLNYMFRNGLIMQLIDLVIENIEYTIIYDIIAEQDITPSLSKSISKPAEYIKWEKYNILKDLVDEITTYIFTIIGKGMLMDDYSTQQKEIKKKISDLKNTKRGSERAKLAYELFSTIENKLSLFKSYKEMFETEAEGE